MKSVGIRQLKNHLSRYLRLVREGETVLVTDRDEVVAEIHKPTTPGAPGLSAWDLFLNDLERKGTLRRAKRRKSIIPPPVRSEGEPEVDWKSILDEVRADRF